MRLDKVLANSGYGTRSEVKDYFRQGRVCLQGAIIRDPGFSVTEEQLQDLTLDGVPVLASEHLYFCLYKPDGYLTAMTDDRLPCVGDLLPTNLKTKKISPVGRLDYHTTGVLLLTNDGELSHRLTSPKWHCEKEYLVTYEGDPLTEKETVLFASGMTLREKDHAPEKLKPAKLELLSDHQCRLTLTEGKTHQVKRMLAQTGRPVIALHRESIGSLRLREDQKPGEMYALSSDDIDELKDLSSDL
ncbi:MAG: rRNA pseudouridine synthase [Clostridiales bacterium]|nr:rRNA pseudouridine synthase [Clostridiales bacterium]